MKPKYRYNIETKEWDRILTPAFIPGYTGVNIKGVITIQEPISPPMPPNELDIYLQNNPGPWQNYTVNKEYQQTREKSCGENLPQNFC